MTGPLPLVPEQDAFPNGPGELVLVGPPGTGKTRAVLTHWLVPAVNERSPEDVLGCSFTKAAAREMLGRLAEATRIDRQGLRTVCRTIHSESLRLIRNAGLPHEIFDRRAVADDDELGGDWEALSTPERDIDREAERLWTVARHRFPRDLDSTPVERLLARVAGDGCTHPVENLAAAVRHLEACKRAAGQIDFTDMMLQALHLPAPRRSLLVVDEAQDLSPLQILVIRRWAERTEQLVWVGDPDQGIYGFAGADGRYLTDLIQHGVPTRLLTHSWRVPRTVHSIARHLILRNRERVDAPYEAGQAEGQVAECLEPELAARVCAEASGERFVLARTARALDPYATWLEEQGVPFVRERGGSSPLRRADMTRLVVALWHLTRAEPLPRDAAFALAKQLPGRPTGRWFRGTKAACMAALKASGEPTADRTELEAVGLRCDELLPPLASDELRTVEGILGRLGLLQEAAGHLRILRRRGPRGLTEPALIRLTTIHSAKGREADLVVLDLSCTRPTQREIGSGRAGSEAERRVLYVGLTRTRNGLILVRSHPGSDLGELLGMMQTRNRLKVAA